MLCFPLELISDQEAERRTGEYLGDVIGGGSLIGPPQTERGIEPHFVLAFFIDVLTYSAPALFPCQCFLILHRSLDAVVETIDLDGLVPTLALQHFEM